MNVLIVYDTKFGFTEKCARYLNDNLPRFIIYRVFEDFDILNFSNILLGTYIYYGQVSENAINFLKTHIKELLKKELDIFCSALDKNDYFNALQNSLELEIFYHAKIVLPGVKVNLCDLTFFEKRKFKKRINIRKIFNSNI